MFNPYRFDFEFLSGQAFDGMPMGINADFDAWRSGNWRPEKRKTRAGRANNHDYRGTPVSILMMSAACPVPAFTAAR